jgi:hypothetical protein
MTASTPHEPAHEPECLPVSPLDGPGAGDHDVPYRFGFRPRAVAPFPFSERQYARLLVLRGRVADRQHGGRPVEFTVIDGWQRPAAA